MSTATTGLALAGVAAAYLAGNQLAGRADASRARRGMLEASVGASIAVALTWALTPPVGITLLLFAAAAFVAAMRTVAGTVYGFQVSGVSVARLDRSALPRRKSDTWSDPCSGDSRSRSVGSPHSPLCSAGSSWPRRSRTSAYDKPAARGSRSNRRSSSDQPRRKPERLRWANSTRRREAVPRSCYDAVAHAFRGVDLGALNARSDLIWRLSGVRRRLSSGTRDSPQPRISTGVAAEAGDGARTHDPQLGKLMLYQLSYARVVRAF